MTNKDWKGNSKSVHSTLAANNHSNEVRHDHDLYCTNPKALDILLAKFTPCQQIWECAAGLEHLSRELRTRGFDVYSSDKYLYDCDNIVDQVDFLQYKKTEIYNSFDIITNPPYKYAEEFIRKGLEIIEDRRHVCMFLPIRYLEGKKRKKLFEEYPPLMVIISSERLECAKNGNFKGQSAQAYAWFVWRKGHKTKTIIEWV